MRLKDLFTVPAGQKVTEKYLRRVLISSICSILLCMSCLVSATWAWFAVSIENKGNELKIETPEVTVTVDGAAVASVNSETATSSAIMEAGDHTVVIKRVPNQDDLKKDMAFYVALTIQNQAGDVSVYDAVVTDTYTVTIKTNGVCQLNWKASWSAPEAPNPIVNDEISVIIAAPADPSTETTTDSSTETTTESSSETTTAPSTETTAAPSTETTTESSSETTAAPSTETTAAPSTETTAAPSTETTAASTTEAATESTGTDAEPAA